ncbi:DUF6777 domain-containing protein [Pseudonocardia phyllosphaerae]|uniref:DUF6777 domain-containing protein n=1 Tax=Pseudonocardia phyllosphaerae TaxID=3390502 RepID=UPI003979D779
MTRPMPPQPRYAAAPPSPPARRRIPAWAFLLVAAAVGLTVAGTLLLAFASPARAEVVREPVNTAGANPFMPAVGADATGIVAPAGAAGTFAGDTAGLYGGTRSNATCDAAKLTGYLGQHPDKAAAWAGALGIGTGDITGYVRGLTPVVLRADTVVTNHGWADGRATAFTSVLQAGSAVFVDRWGAPVVRCSCGNPLAAAPALVWNSVYWSGPTWVSFSETNVSVVVNSSVEVHDYTLVDTTRSETFARPVASSGAQDGAARPVVPGAGSAAPGSSVPGSSVPGSAVPGSSVPGSSVPGSSVPGSAAPGSSGTDGSVPGDAVPGASGSGGSVPGEPGTGSGGTDPSGGDAGAPFDAATGTYSLPCGQVTLNGGSGSAGGTPVQLLDQASGTLGGAPVTVVLLQCGDDAPTAAVVDGSGRTIDTLSPQTPPGSTKPARFGSGMTLSGSTLTTPMEVFEAGDTTTPTGTQTWTWRYSGGGFTVDESSVQPVAEPSETTEMPEAPGATEPTESPEAPSSQPAEPESAVPAETGTGAGTSPQVSEPTTTTTESATPSSESTSAGSGG